MSESERHAALGKMLEEHAQAKQEFAILLKKAEEIGSAYDAMAQYLKSHANAPGSKNLRMGADGGTLVAAIPEKIETARVIHDAISALRRKTSLAESLKASGYEVAP